VRIFALQKVRQLHNSKRIKKIFGFCLGDLVLGSRLRGEKKKLVFSTSFEPGPFDFAIFSDFDLAIFRFLTLHFFGFLTLRFSDF
jgi:hypothetical protein